ncbi:hypothetical protein AB0I81_27025 [Nonomuraea sp. NPDC050404]|uniref:hypothetical protein n=1 Tax=Nonomuraea sp. NPDC050404 TaxID=3155783 RepID=UPI0033F5753F
MLGSVDLFADDPMTCPLTYPGRVPPGSGMLVDDAYVPMSDGQAFAAVLAAEGCAPLDARHRVVAVGSNAAPSQLRRKFLNHRVRPIVPMTLAEVRGIAPGVSAHVSKWGYVPAAPIETPGESSRLFVLWLDEHQLGALDLTEPNYRRRPLADPVTLESGTSLPPPFVYEGRHGCLAGPDGQGRRLTPQRTLIQSLLDDSPALRHLCGNTPEDFVDNVRDDTVREAAYAVLQSESRFRSG